jgi:hypothetical protein
LSSAIFGLSVSTVGLPYVLVQEVNFQFLQGERLDGPKVLIPPGKKLKLLLVLEAKKQRNVFFITSLVLHLNDGGQTLEGVVLDEYDMMGTEVPKRLTISFYGGNVKILSVPGLNPHQEKVKARRFLHRAWR